MDGHAVVTMVACAGHLAFALVAFNRRSKSALADLLALLFLDVFAWNFADLAHELSGAKVWHRIDRFFSSLMAALALHVVIVFVGRARALKPLVIAGYVVFGLLAVFGHGYWWWKAVLVSGTSAMLFAAVLLIRHRRRTPDPAERTRAELVLLAIAIGTLFSSTDLWYDEVSFPAPRLGAAGTLLAMALFALATLRLRLLGRDVPRILAFYALLVGVLWAVGGFALIRWLDPATSSWALAGVVLLLVVLASLREIGRSTALARSRTEELVTLGRFSEQLAHDLRNPLAALKGALQFLNAEREDGRSLDGHPEFLGLMLDQVGRMERVVGGYQRVAKVEPVLQSTDLNELVKGTLSLQRFAVVPGTIIKSELAEHLPGCALDRDLVATALENVVRNACEAMPDGGSVTVRTALDPSGDHVRVSVEDDGPGMDPRELERAPDAFFTTKAKGSGLGLSFADRVAKAHGGALRLTSEVGKGSLVELSFRVTPENPS